jgi:hypothetical protein
MSRFSRVARCPQAALEHLVTIDRCGFVYRFYEAIFGVPRLHIPFRQCILERYWLYWHEVLVFRVQAIKRCDDSSCRIHAGLVAIKVPRLFLKHPVIINKFSCAFLLNARRCPGIGSARPINRTTLPADLRRQSTDSNTMGRRNHTRKSWSPGPIQLANFFSSSVGQTPTPPQR